ncbi:hypothetical protein GCM10010977_33130 [Citricoccus zhacaiensis]|uniref:Uncharacterized protein n=1 Tax=Citricoccus zhacaiensis TaxID=489142 RepID=A0ABQ2MCF5_9MICC|nr:hypothetical protein GCM10010977_33130 [Citricoccus zhacaiensis]
MSASTPAQVVASSLGRALLELGPVPVQGRGHGVMLDLAHMDPEEDSHLVVASDLA